LHDAGHAERHHQRRDAHQCHAKAVDEPDAKAHSGGRGQRWKNSSVLAAHDIAGHERTETDERADR
jgi:hypothetical protein